jgi:aminopeptidase N
VVPELLAFFGEKFGPYPFPDSKFAFAQSPIWGMEHSTIIAYGNSFPATRALEGEPDPFALRNQYYDYIVVHEAAHEWWGNAITARDWSDFWIHEGFATYAEALWVERLRGQEAMLDFMQEKKREIVPEASVYRPYHATAGEAFANVTYDKGAFVLHMLRYVMGDEIFFAALLDFATDPRFRYGSASTGDFQEVCEKHLGRSLREFFQPWIFGTGWPRYVVRPFQPGEGKVDLEILGRSDSYFPFRMPLDLELITADGSRIRHRVELKEGVNRFALPVAAPVKRVEYPGFRWMLCDVQISR